MQTMQMAQTWDFRPLGAGGVICMKVGREAQFRSGLFSLGKTCCVWFGVDSLGETLFSVPAAASHPRPRAALGRLPVLHVRELSTAGHGGQEVGTAECVGALLWGAGVPATPS